MPRELTREIWLPQPRSEVFAFFADAGNLQVLTPPWLHFQILTPLPIEMKPGTIIDYQLRLRGFAMKWRTEITVWEPPHRFVDAQTRGPYRLWEHEHAFEERDGGTRVIDRVRYQSRGWLLEPLIQRFFVGPDLRRIFDYRQVEVAKRFG